MTPNQLQFEVESVDRIHIDGRGGSDCRLECAAEILSDLVREAPLSFIGKKGGIWYCDGPPGSDWLARHELRFCSTKRLGQTSPFLPFPCPMFLRWPQVGIADARILMTELVENEVPYQDNRVFWIGANTHPSREALTRLSHSHPEWIDAEIMEWDRGAVGGQRSKTRQASIPEHRNYKYLIDCPGYGYSARLKWLLATGRPVFIIDRDTVEHWHDDLKPWVHYIPVAKDLSDLAEKWHRLEAEPDLYVAIGRQAKDFAAQHLTIEARRQVTLRALADRLGVPR